MSENSFEISGQALLGTVAARSSTLYPKPFIYFSNWIFVPLTSSRYEQMATKFQVADDTLCHASSNDSSCAGKSDGKAKMWAKSLKKSSTALQCCTQPMIRLPRNASFKTPCLYRSLVWYGIISTMTAFQRSPSSSRILALDTTVRLRGGRDTFWTTAVECVDGITKAVLEDITAKLKKESVQILIIIVLVLVIDLTKCSTIVLLYSMWS